MKMLPESSAESLHTYDQARCVVPLNATATIARSAQAVMPVQLRVGF